MEDVCFMGLPINDCLVRHLLDDMEYEPSPIPVSVSLSIMHEEHLLPGTESAQ